MKLKIITIFIVLMIAGGALGGNYLYTKNQEQIKEKKEQERIAAIEQEKLDVTTGFISDLKTSLDNIDNDITDKTNLHVSYNVYYIKSDSSTSNFNAEDLSTEQFFLASTIKPLFITSYLKVLNITDLEAEVSFKFIDDEKYKKQISTELFDNLTYGYSADILIEEDLAPLYAGQHFSNADEVYNFMITNPELQNLKFTIRKLIQYALGPSSNWAITLLRHDISFKKGFTSEEDSANEIENYLNSFLPENYEKSLRLNYSSKSIADKTINSASFKDFNYLMDAFFKNKFEIDSETYNLMTSSMTDISSDYVQFNRRHEIKSILKDNGITPKVPVIEKSGYIGLDFESAPGLMKALGIDTLPAIDGKRIVVYFANTFAKIELNNGYSILISYQISKPVYLSLDPHYEELNDDYLAPKNEIFDAIVKNVGEAIAQHKDLIE